MLSLTKLLTEDSYFGDQLRYTEDAAAQRNGVSPGRGPVVVWNYTRSCNLHCIHCYAAAEDRSYEGELNTEEALRVIDELADFHVPVILFSGGEPLYRKDFFTLAEHARQKGIRPTLSTNGTLITPEVARQIKAVGVGYVGISLDGIGDTNDRFRGMKGAYDKALEGVRNCRAAGQRVGFRFTINRRNAEDIDRILDLMETEDVDRICFYHLVYSGRGAAIQKEDLTGLETRAVLDRIIERTLDFHRWGMKKEILMVDNHADGPYLYLKAKEIGPERAAYVLRMLRQNGGNRSGMAFGEIDYLGNVHPDQFTQHVTFGNVRKRTFKDIWCSMDDPIQAGLKDRKKLLPEICKKCSWLYCCNGNFRARAEAASGDFWGMDPACYLTEEERSMKLPDSDQV